MKSWRCHTQMFQLCDRDNVGPIVHQCGFTLRAVMSAIQEHPVVRCHLSARILLELRFD